MRTNKIIFFLLSSLLTFASCERSIEKEEFQQEEIIEEVPFEIFTRANMGVQSFTGNTELQVGLRQTYTIKLSKALSVYTYFSVFASDLSAVRFTRPTDVNYTQSGFIEMGYPANTTEIKFDMLPIEPVEGLRLSFSSKSGTVINAILENININKPIIQIEAPSTCFYGDGFTAKIPYSYSFLSDRVINFSYNNYFLNMDEVVKTNTGYNTFFDANGNLGETTIKGTIVGTYNSDKFYEIASAEHMVKIEKKEVTDPELPPPYDPSTIVIEGPESICDFEKHQYTLKNHPMNNVSWTCHSLSGMEFVDHDFNTKIVKLRRRGKAHETIYLTARFYINNKEEMTVSKKIDLCNLYTLEDARFWIEMSYTEADIEIRNWNNRSTVRWEVIGDGYEVRFQTFPNKLYLKVKNRKVNSIINAYINLDGKERILDQNLEPMPNNTILPPKMRD